MMTMMMKMFWTLLMFLVNIGNPGCGPDITADEERDTNSVIFVKYDTKDAYMDGRTGKVYYAVIDAEMWTWGDGLALSVDNYDFGPYDDERIETPVAYDPVNGEFQINIYAGESAWKDYVLVDTVEIDNLRTFGIPV